VAKETSFATLLGIIDTRLFGKKDAISMKIKVTYSVV